MRQRGAVLVEFVVSLPLLLLLIFGIIFFSYVAHLRSQLATAVRIAPMLATTRSFSDVYFNIPALLQKTKSYHDGSAELPDYYYQGMGRVDAESWLNSTWLDVDSPMEGAASGFRASPLFAKYMIAYAYEYLRLSMGPGLRFPCLPDGSPEQAGCTVCSVILSEETVLQAQDPIREPPIFEMSCTAQMPQVFTELLSGMLRYFGGSQRYLIFSASTYPAEAGGQTFPGGM